MQILLYCLEPPVKTEVDTMLLVTQAAASDQLSSEGSWKLRHLTILESKCVGWVWSYHRRSCVMHLDQLGFQLLLQVVGLRRSGATDPRLDSQCSQLPAVVDSRWTFITSSDTKLIVDFLDNVPVRCSSLPTVWDLCLQPSNHLANRIIWVHTS